MAPSKPYTPSDRSCFCFDSFRGMRHTITDYNRVAFNSSTPSVQPTLRWTPQRRRCFALRSRAVFYTVRLKASKNKIITGGVWRKKVLHHRRRRRSRRRAHHRHHQHTSYPPSQSSDVHISMTDRTKQQQRQQRRSSVKKNKPDQILLARTDWTG